MDLPSILILAIIARCFPVGTSATEPVQSLGCEDPLEEEMATHSASLAWEIPWTEEPSKLQLMGSQKVEHD